jgi:multidrug efflux pump subunit AcrB
MSFGSPTPIEVAVSGPDMPANRAYAEHVREALAHVPTLRDLQIIQTTDYPTVDITVDRERAGIAGVQMADIARSTVAATSSSRFVTPVFWADPKSGVGYQVQVEVPQAQMISVEDIKNIPVVRQGQEPILLQNVAAVTQGRTAGKYDRYNMQRQVSMTANIAGEDLGHTASRITEALKGAGDPPPRVTVSTRGQIPPMEATFAELRTGLLLATVVILLLLAANFQSFLLALTVVSTVPAVLCGVITALWLTSTTLNIQSFMGAIMAIGVCVANAILLVTFAEQSRIQGMTSPQAAVRGAVSRLRPIVMTSMAMIAGMIPMAMKWGEGAEQAAPLGRAVIGGLVAATMATLFVLPAIFPLLRRSHAVASSVHPDDSEAHA